MTISLRYIRCVLAWLVAIGLPAARAEESSVSIFGWADYIDPRVLEDFSKETGIRLTYDSFYSESEANGKFGTRTKDYDVVMVPDALLPQEIRNGFLQKLDKTKLSELQNLDTAIIEKLAKDDPAGQYALPYMWFSLGVGYNVGKIAEKLGENEAGAAVLQSWESLLRPEVFKKLSDCGVAVLDDQRALFAIALRSLRLDPDTKNLSDLKRASDLLSTLRRSVKSFAVPSTFMGLATGDLCLVIDQSSHIFQAREQAEETQEDVKIGFSLPREGAVIFIDSLAIPKDAAHPKEAYQFLDYLMRPEIAARNSNFTRFATSVSAAKALILRPITEDKIIFPDAAALARLNLPNQDLMQQKWIDREWVRIKSQK